MADDIAGILKSLRQGDGDAVDDLLPLLYGELKSIAANQMQRERPDHTLSPTALVNEAYLRLASQNRAQWKNRSHFCAIAAQLMRRILVDHARKKQTLKRNGASVQMTIDAALAPSGNDVNVDLVAMDELLDQLSQHNARHGRVVELRFFAGLTIDEVAQTLEISPTTVKDDWRVARAWLMAKLGPKTE